MPRLAVGHRGEQLQHLINETPTRSIVSPIDFDCTAIAYGKEHYVCLGSVYILTTC
jgi:hypothetical protein